MTSPVSQRIVLLTAAPMQTSVNSARIDSSNYRKGMIMAIWTGNDSLDATVNVEGSIDGDNWGTMGAVLDDVGSVTLDTLGGNQQWSFREFPFPFVRLVYTAGTNTTGAVTIIFGGSVEAPGI